ncbi:multidrug effflux MFS transporter [Enterobacter bugandensis]|uniref:multidrug effflux MFS transporter n=1 Tax=Enterobacter bugandensis TaxID=881260 RepID=UPI0021D129CC|nr:multidrug effflux MFS transporter [Enterobacter bugandensis]
MASIIKKNIFILILALYTMLDALSIDLYTPAFPAMAVYFGTPVTTIQVTLSIFLISLAAGQLLWGIVMDCYGRKVPLIIGGALFVIGSVLAAFASCIPQIMFARSLQALGAASGLVGPRAMITDRFSGEEAARMFSVLMQIFMAAPILAPLLGVLLVTYCGWQSTFIVLVFFGALVTISAILKLPETRTVDAHKRTDITQCVRNYFSLIKDKKFILNSITGGLVFGVLFSYYAISPYIVLTIFSKGTLFFGLLAAFNGFLVIISGKINNHFISIHTPEKILKCALFGLFTLGLATASVNLNINLTGYALFSSVTMFLLGLMFGNNTYITLSSRRGASGAATAAALMGVIQNGIGAILSFIATTASNSQLVSLPLMAVLCAGTALFIQFIIASI